MSSEGPSTLGKMLLMVIVVIGVVVILMNAFGIVGTVKGELYGFSQDCLQWTQTNCKDTDQYGIFVTAKGKEVDIFTSCQAEMGTAYQSAQTLYVNPTAWTKFWNDCRGKCSGMPPQNDVAYDHCVFCWHILIMTS